MKEWMNEWMNGSFIHSINNSLNQSETLPSAIYNDKNYDSCNHKGCHDGYDDKNQVKSSSSVWFGTFPGRRVPYTSSLFSW